MSTNFTESAEARRPVSTPPDAIQALFLSSLPQPHARPVAVLGDELDAGGFEGGGGQPSCPFDSVAATVKAVHLSPARALLAFRQIEKLRRAH